jgi:hypothetical protein
MILTALLVLATWTAVLLVAAGCGLCLTSAGRASASLHLRAALWLGLAGMVLAVLVINLVAPLSGIAVILLLAIFVAVAAVGYLRAGQVLLTAVRRIRPAPSIAILLAVLAVAAGLLALVALGVPTNYDAGLYQLQAVDYAHVARTIPGLANIHDRLGFNSSLYPLAATLGNGVWEGQGFRLVTGVLLLALGADTALRLVTAPRRVGTLLLVIATPLVWGYALIEPGRLVASPVADMTATVMALASTAALVDALGRHRRPDAVAVAVVTAALGATMRPLGWLFLAVVLAVLLVRRRAALGSGWVRASLVLSAMLGLVMVVRDVLLSGWILFPLGLLPLPVDWRYPDPGLTSTAITEWARAPHQDPSAASGTAWIVPWVWSLRTDWAVVAAGGLLAITAVTWVVLRLRRTPGPILRRPALLAGLPALVVVGAWWVSAPDARFAWGPILVLGALPAALVLARARRGAALAVLLGAAVLVVATMLSVLRGGFAPVLKDTQPQSRTTGPIVLTLSLAPVKEVPVTKRTLADGTTVLEPVADLQCWRAFPLCRLPGSADDIVSRGDTLTDGFRPR